MEQINLLQPAFVVSVGDLIQGYSKDQETLAKEWKELQGFTSKLQMPFFYVPGNHDLANPTETEVWKERFGRRYYHFLYKDVLFLAVCTDDPNESKENGKLSKEQVEYFQKVLAENPEVRWTFVRFPLFGQRFSLQAAPFVDDGRVFDKLALALTQWKPSAGGGLRVGWNQSTIIMFDFGVSNEDTGFFIDFGMPF